MFLLCPIQSGIRPFDQLRGGALIRAAQGDTAGACGLETVRQREFLKFLADSLALLQDRIQRGDAPENHHEFISAVTAENISVPGLTAEQISEKAKHFIPLVVAELVVDLLQIIQIKQIHGQREILLTQRVQSGKETSAVQKTGQIVPACFVYQQLLPDVVGIHTHHLENPSAQILQRMVLAQEIIGVQFLQILLAALAIGHRGQYGDPPAGRVLPDGLYQRQSALFRKGGAEDHRENRSLAAFPDAGDSLLSGSRLQHLIMAFKELPDFPPVFGILIRHQQLHQVGFGLRGGIGGFRILWRLGLQQFLKLPGGHGPRKEVTLNVVAADLPQALQLLPGLHALRHHAQIQPAGQSHNEPQDSLLHGLGGFASDELHVQLQDVQLHLVEHIEGRIAAAEVIHFNDEAQLPQMLHGAEDLSRVFRIGALGQLQMELGGLHAVFPDDLQQRIRQVGMADVRPGHIDRHRQLRISFFPPEAQRGTHIFPDIPVQPGDKTVFLKQGNEFSRGQKAQLRVNPAHQSLGPRQTVIVQAVLRLIIDNKLPFVQCGLHGLRNGLLPQQLAPQNIIIDREVAIILIFNAVHRQIGPIAHLLHRNGTVSDLVDAPLHHHVAAPAGFRLIRVKDSPVPGLLSGLLQAYEPVRAEPSADPRRLHRPAHGVRGFPQQPIPFRHAEGIIIQLKIYNIGANDAVFSLRILPKPLPHLLIEELPAEEPGQPVILEQIHHGGCFPQLNDAGDPVQNHLGPVGLGNKIRGAVSQGGYLIGLAVALGHDDDGDQRKPVICLD